MRTTGLLGIALLIAVVACSGDPTGNPGLSMDGAVDLSDAGGSEAGGQAEPDGRESDTKDVGIRGADSSLQPDAGPCVPQCKDMECGADGCGGICGVCSDGELCFSGICQPAPDCQDDADCDPYVCDDETGECAACLDGNECPDGTVCDLASGLCVECYDDHHCPPGTECINEACVPLGPCTPESCFPLVCDPATGGCIPCLLDNNCKPLADSCNEETGECEDCVSDCGGKQCGSDGCGGSCGDCGDGGTCSNGTCTAGWLDPATNLVWQNPPGEEKFDWYEAEDYCDDLEWGGSKDWYLPSLDQLEGIMVDEGGPCKWKLPLTGVCHEYWSSTHDEDTNNQYFVVDFEEGDVQDDDAEDDENYARCVRNGP